MAGASPCASASTGWSTRSSFREIGSIAGKAEYDGSNDLVDLMPANAVMGRAKIDGRPVAVTGDDFTVRGGSADATIKEKDIFIERYANQYRVPLIRMIEGSGGGGSVKTIETTGRANVPGVRGWEWVVQQHGHRADGRPGPRLGRRAWARRGSPPRTTR